MPLLIAGGAWVVVGGLVAAVTGPTEWTRGSWVAAFLVLVAGVAQVGIGAGQAQLPRRAPAAAVSPAQCVMWNVGCVTVISGTLLESPLVVAAGSAPILAVLVMSIVATAGPAISHPVAAFAYRALLLVVLTSVPIGIALSFARH